MGSLKRFSGENLIFGSVPLCLHRLPTEILDAVSEYAFSLALLIGQAFFSENIESGIREVVLSAYQVRNQRWTLLTH